MIKEAEELANRHKYNIDFEQISLFDYNPKKKFDLIISNHVMMYLVKCYPAVLQKVTRLLNTNGRLFAGDSFGFRDIYLKGIDIFDKLLMANDHFIISEGGAINSSVIFAKCMEEHGFRDIKLEIKLLHKFNTDEDKYKKYIETWGWILSKVAPHLFSENDNEELINAVKDIRKETNHFVIIPQSYVTSVWGG